MEEKKPYKLRIKIGQAEFEAEGSEETVKAQFKEFQDLIVKKPNPSEQRESVSNTENMGDSETQRFVEEYESIFKINDDKTLSLRVLPSENDGKFKQIADSALVLLYGFNKVFSRTDVTALTLTRVLRESGIGVIKRIDVPLSQYLKDGFITRAGKGKGTSYRTSNKGNTQANALIQKMIEHLS